jgi:hypothetical protein
MPGAGYNIPISISAAETFSVPQTTNAPTIFAFRGGSFGANTVSPENINPATATSAAAEGNAGASSSGSGVMGILGQGGLTTEKAVLIGFGALALVGLVAVFMLRHRRG